MSQDMSTVSQSPACHDRPHVVHWYDPSKSDLEASVAAFLHGGIERGCRAIVVARPEHERGIVAALEALGADPKRLRTDGGLRSLDAADALATFMVDGYPDETRFDATIGAFAREALEGTPGDGLVVFGEMVGLLWQSGQFPAAIRLEQLWNRLTKVLPIDLYCAYPVDVFDAQFDGGIIDGLLCAHTAVVPARDNDRLLRAVRHATKAVLGADIELIGPLYCRDSGTGRAPLPRGEEAILWLRDQLPSRAEEILALAAAYYRSPHRNGSAA